MPQPLNMSGAKSRPTTGRMCSSAMIPAVRQWPTLELMLHPGRFSGSSASAKKRSSGSHQSRLKRSLRAAAEDQYALASTVAPSERSPPHRMNAPAGLLVPLRHERRALEGGEPGERRLQQLPAVEHRRLPGGGERIPPEERGIQGRSGGGCEPAGRVAFEQREGAQVIHRLFHHEAEG